MTSHGRKGSVAYFTDDQEVYRFIGRLFEDLIVDDELAPRFKKANTIVQYRYRDPEAQITVKSLGGRTDRSTSGPPASSPRWCSRWRPTPRIASGSGRST